MKCVRNVAEAGWQEVGHGGFALAALAVACTVTAATERKS
jgi:hypothetical protein